MARDYHLATNPFIGTFTKMYLELNDGEENIEVYRDVRKMNQDTSFVWNVNGISNNISGNIKLSWNENDIQALSQLLNENAEGSAYSIAILIGEEEYPYDMITKKGSILSSISSIANTDADQNYVLIRNIFEEPIEDNFKAYLVNHETKKIEEQFNVKTQSPFNNSKHSSFCFSVIGSF